MAAGSSTRYPSHVEYCCPEAGALDLYTVSSRWRACRRSTPPDGERRDEPPPAGKNEGMTEMGEAEKFSRRAWQEGLEPGETRAYFFKTRNRRRP